MGASFLYAAQLHERRQYYPLLHHSFSRQQNAGGRACRNCCNAHVTSAQSPDLGTDKTMHRHCTVGCARSLFGAAFAFLRRVRSRPTSVPSAR